MEDGARTMERKVLSLLLVIIFAMSAVAAGSPIMQSNSATDKESFTTSSIEIAMVFSTYLGGTFYDEAFAVGVDSSGNTFVAGYTWSDDFPTYNAMNSTPNSGEDIFIAKFSPAGQLLFSTYFGGTTQQLLKDLTVDDSGNVYLTGSTHSSDFPIMNGYQEAHGGGGPDAFVTIINGTGSNVIASTFFGGSSSDVGLGIDLDGEGNIYIVGLSESTNLPTTAGVYQEDNAGNDDVFVAKLNSTANGLEYCTYLGGFEDDVGYDIEVDDAGYCYISGYTLSDDFPTLNQFDSTLNGTQDAFVAKLDPSGDLVYSTYLGGTNDDEAKDLTIDAGGRCYITGITQSDDFPMISSYNNTHGGGRDAFVVRLASAGNVIQYSTYLGGADRDEGNEILLDSQGYVYIAGMSQSSDFPIVSQIAIGEHRNQDAFITKMSPDGSSLLLSTLFGGVSSDFAQGIALGPDELTIHMAGQTFGPLEEGMDGLPTLNAYQDTHAGEWGVFHYDAYVTVFSQPGPTTTSTTSTTTTTTSTTTSTASTTTTTTTEFPIRIDVFIAVGAAGCAIIVIIVYVVLRRK